VLAVGHEPLLSEMATTLIGAEFAGIELVEAFTPSDIAAC
jgi:phosphohistidine phosphatase SixA